MSATPDILNDYHPDSSSVSVQQQRTAVVVGASRGVGAAVGPRLCLYARFEAFA